LVASRRDAGLRWRIVGPLFELLYRNRTLYWMASTIPFAGQWRVWQRLAIPRLHGRGILEVGCGIGTLVADMAGAGYTCVAIDRSPQMVAATRARLRRRRIPASRASVQQADVRALPFADASFDSVVSTFPTDYIADPRALAEIARVLRLGGCLIVVLGATLLPASLALLPLVAVQTLVYGSGRHVACASDGGPALTADAAKGDDVGGTDDRFAALLASVGLAPRVERVRGPFWVAVVYVAQKSDS
jgi:SAM-dependent methyltransferase